MSRSTWKPIFYGANFERQIAEKATPLIAPRTLKLTGDLLGKNLSIHNGRRLVNISVQIEHLGYQAGEFSLSHAKASPRNKKIAKK